MLLALASFTPTTQAQEAMIGEICLFAGNFAPRGWAFCDGQLVQISQNQALFSILGTTYGGDGRTTFALPKLDSPLAKPTATAPIPITAKQSVSIPSGASVDLQFVNKTKQIVTAYWVDWSGDEISYGTIEPEATMNQQSGLKQLWRFKHGDTLVAEYVLTKTKKTYEVKFASRGTSSGNTNTYPKYIISLNGIYPSRN